MLISLDWLSDFVDLPDADSASNQTIGVRFTGKTEISDGMNLLYTAEYAQQSDYSGGSSIIDADYNLKVMKRGNRALLGSGVRPLNKEDREDIEQYILDFYEVFVDRVARGRKMPRERVKEIAGGRIYTGEDAQ